MNRGDIKLVIDQLDRVELQYLCDTDTVQTAINMLETLGNKVAELETLCETRNEHIRLWQNSYDEQVKVSQARADKIAEQAAVIEKLRTALCVMLGDSEADPWLSAEDKRRVAYEALAIPTDSKQVLNDWMREQLGEPVAWACWADDDNLITQDRASLLRIEPVQYKNKYPLYKLPDILK